MFEFFDKCIERYTSIAKKHWPDYKLEPADIPFVDEDCVVNPARRAQPNQDGSFTGFVCPHCVEAFAQDEYIPVSNAAEAAKVCKDLRENQSSLRFGGACTLAGNQRQDGTTANVGVLSGEACNIIMQVFYGARQVRVDLVRAITFLAQIMTKWSTDCDRR